MLVRKENHVRRVESSLKDGVTSEDLNRLHQDLIQYCGGIYTGLESIRRLNNPSEGLPVYERNRRFWENAAREDIKQLKRLIQDAERYLGDLMLPSV